ncbi:tRNA dimethylallyltransferase isoform X2 [Bicyclus anynana]|uniref:tRNA dimethylallyltransferase isoform X2 n=1 Tax=Bicyclus anynana TaxID=110368 RepID=A0ABM3LRV0_BICAN|nr:tRNA dimethylallyltransferase isoform X2 [Bicyclus anynana]
MSVFQCPGKLEKILTAHVRRVLHVNNIYKGLDIVTAKASRQERELVKHHLLDILEPHQVFTVVDFRARSLKIIDNLTKQGKIPIIVGGTNYYIESIVYQILVEHTDDTEELLWDRSKRKRDFYETDPINEESNKKLAKESDNPKNVVVLKQETEDKSEKQNLEDQESILNSEIKDNISFTKYEEDKVIDRETLKQDVDNESKFTNEEIHSKLKAIDPVMASRLHPNNRRKILRAIEVWLKTGRRHSEVLDEQKTSEGQLRRPGATIILWLKCEQSVHDERLNARVDSMLEEGLIDELLDFHDRHNKQRMDGNPPDYTKGVFQTLGLKEFHQYLMLPAEEKNTEEGKKLLQESIANMKLGTRRYARRQNKMVRGRFLEHPSREVPPIYELDTTDLTKWDEEVKNKAFNIIDSFINASPCQHEPLKQFISDDKRSIDGHSSNYCDVCERLIIGDKEFSIHLNSHKHMRVIKRKKRIALQLEKQKLAAKPGNYEKLESE